MSSIFLHFLIKGDNNRRQCSLPHGYYEKNWGKSVLTICFELTKQIVEIKGETCCSLPIRQLCNGFSPHRLVASRRHGRRFASLAVLPAAPAAPLSQKSRFAAIFGSPVYFSGHALYRTRGDFTSIRMLTREKRKKCDFSFFSYLFAQRGIYLLPFLRLKGFRDTFWNTPEGGRIRNDLPFCTRSLDLVATLPRSG